MPLPDYAELHCLSNFTFLRGASQPAELVARAAALGYRALAITDECSLAGVVRAHLAIREQHLPLRLIIGCELRLSDGPDLVLLASDRASYGALARLVTHARRTAGKGHYQATRQLVAQMANSAAGEGCLALLLADAEPAIEPARWVAGCFPGRAWIAVNLTCDGADDTRLATLTALGNASGLPLVATGNVHMHRRARRALQDTLTAIRLRQPLSEVRGALYPNGERHLRPREQLARRYPAALLAETLRIAERCHFSLDSLRYEYPQELVPAGRDADDHLRQLTGQGMRRRWPRGAPPKVQNLVEHELTLIAELGYAHYFLTVHDLVVFARSRGILCQGRGSAANSAVCYCLGITEVDPARMNVLFERFISRERNEPPDIDVDFEHQRREEVIQYLYRKYGRERAGLTASVVSYRPKSALRDVGKALGLDSTQLDRLIGNISWWDGAALREQRLREAGFDPQNPVIRQLLVLTGQLLGFPRHLSQHVGGFVISRGPLCELVPIENAAMAGRTVIQWDKDDLDALGLLKIDVLALGMLSAIRNCLHLLSRYHRRSFSMATIPAEDAATYAMIQRADTVGVFQIESRAQMSMLPRLRPATFYDLVIEVAIVRPGPIQGGMVHPYLRRRQGLEPVDYPSEAVRQVLDRTLGIPIFQEQVIQLAMVAAGFSAGEADQLRRAMAAWKRRGGLEPFERRLIDGMAARGYSPQFAEQLFAQIRGFGEYGFPESHAASFALLAYVSAYLKCHHPAAYTAALLNSQPMGFYAPAQLLQDARRHGVTVLPVDALHSHWDCTLEPDSQGEPALRLGLRLIKGLGRPAGRRLVAARLRAQRRLQRALTAGRQATLALLRVANGDVASHSMAGASLIAAGQADGKSPAAPFSHIVDLADKARLTRSDLATLAGAGALDGLAGNRHQAQWQSAGEEPALPLAPAGAEATPLLRPPDAAQTLLADYRHLRFTLGAHPLALLRARLRREGLDRTAAQIRQLPHGTPVRAIGLVINRQRPATARGVIFMTLEDETGFLNLLVWQRTADAQRRPLLQARLLEVAGVLEREGDIHHLIAGRLTERNALLGELQMKSRDFR